MADDFARRFRTQAIDVFSPAGLRRVWTNLGLGYVRFSDDGSNHRSPEHSHARVYAVAGLFGAEERFVGPLLRNGLSFPVTA